MSQEPSPVARILGRAGAVAAAVAAVCGYVNGWNLWQVLVLVALVPGLPAYAAFYNGRFRRYRFLVGIYAVAGMFAVFELWQYGYFPENIAKKIDLPPGAGELDALRQMDLTLVLHELYPDDTETLVRGAQYGPICMGDVSGLHLDGLPQEQRDQMLSTLRMIREQHPYCQSLTEADRRTEREWYELALSTRPKMSEDVYYHYVRVLIASKAPREEVDAAAEYWRKLFPLSRRPDPREAFTGGAWFDGDPADGDSE
jgi:hypothetical protein